MVIDIDLLIYLCLNLALYWISRCILSVVSLDIGLACTVYIQPSKEQEND
jgi:hypothetical protein